MINHNSDIYKSHLCGLQDKLLHRTSQFNQDLGKLLSVQLDAIDLPPLESRSRNVWGSLGPAVPGLLRGALRSGEPGKSPPALNAFRI